MSRSIVPFLLALLPGAVFAQSPVDINVEFFRPTAGESFFALPSAHLLSNLRFKGDAILNFADGSLVAFDNNGNVILVPIERQLVLDAAFGMGLFNFAEIGVAFPIAINQEGDGQDLAIIGGQGQVTGGAPGDLRLTAKARILGKPKQKEGVFVAFTPEVTIPTGSGAEFFGGASASTKLAVSAEWRTPKLSLGLNAGPRFQENVALGNITAGNELSFGGGALFRVHPKVAALAELEGARALVENGPNPLEARAGVRLQVTKDIFIPIGGGFGVTDEVGAPNFRIFVGVSFAPQEQLKDTDQDGLTDDKDECIQQAEDKDQFKDEDGCPEADNDNDQIADKDDACPNDFGPQGTQGCPDADNDGIVDAQDACPNTFGLKEDNGCPDTDGDKIADNKDKCINEREDSDQFEDEDGCPEADNDNDKIADADDICPNQPENYNNVKDNDGCPDPDPKTKEPVAKASSTSETVYFPTGKAGLTKADKKRLDAVYETLKADPSKKVRIEGHADDVGSEKTNQRLSEARAKAGYQYLVKKGIEKERITYEGFGESKPIETGTDKKSRSKNRRIEVIVE